MDILKGARKNDSLAALLFLVFAVLVVGTILLDVQVLWISDRVIDLFNSRWSRYVDRGEHLMVEQRFDEARDYLEDLDSRFPARHAKHALDRDRERLLVALGQVYEETGRRRLARESYSRLVQFDPRNFMNHFELAGCLIRQGKNEEALEPLGRIMEINPSHLPSVGLLVEVHYESGAWKEVVTTWETYLDALIFAEVRLAWSDEETAARVPVDGRFHRLEMNLEVPPSREDSSVVLVTITTQGFPFVLGEIRARPRTQALPSAAAGSVAVRVAPNQQVSGAGPLYTPRDDEEGVVLEVDVGPSGLDHWQVDIRLPKVADDATWQMVAKSYGNLLDSKGLEAARSRSLVIDGVGR